MKALITAALLLSLCAGAFAQPAVEALSSCLADSTNGRDRKALARWIFVAMGAHPDMRNISSIAPGAADDATKAAGQLFTRLLAESCPKQTQEAVKAVGPLALQSAFTLLGQLAMQELMTDKDVAAGMAALQQHVDTKKLEAVLNPR